MEKRVFEGEARVGGESDGYWWIIDSRGIPTVCASELLEGLDYKRVRITVEVLEDSDE